MLLLVTAADQTGRTINLLSIALVAVAIGLAALTVWFWRYTEPKPRQAVDHSEPSVPSPLMLPALPEPPPEPEPASDGSGTDPNRAVDVGPAASSSRGGFGRSLVSEQQRWSSLSDFEHDLEAVRAVDVASIRAEARPTGGISLDEEQWNLLTEAVLAPREAGDAVEDLVNER